MELERWRQIDTLFGAALEHPPQDRTRFLDRACGDDAELRHEVETLLASEGSLEDFLEAPVTGPAPATAPADVGEMIGPYRIEHEIARGGMGAVYLAVRADDEFNRRVAIKVLHSGMRSAAMIRRFHGERQILANLDHPAIARLYDGATTADGRPYLVMEYIEGLSIDRYCDRKQLQVRQRIELFRLICSAVHYAHQNLVVHRDIKPSNILVTRDGAPRLLDFGIAKLLDPEGFLGTVEATLTGMRPMTPQYASPEQVKGGTITTASDVYSLGVLLYLLLAGRLPYDLTGLSPSAVERVLTEEEPELPSTAVAVSVEPPSVGRATPDDSAPEGALAESASRRAKRLRAEAQQLRRRLAGDLDNIILKTLAKDRARRYSSVEQLSDDLRRHLVGLPVLARPKTLGYRLNSYLRRHRLLVGVAALILSLVTAFAAVTARQAAHATRQRDRAEADRDKAERVSQFLIDLFQEADPWVGDGNTVTAREILDRGTEKIEHQLADQPELRASLLNAIGAVYLNLGLFEQATPLLKAALAARTALFGSEHVDVATTLSHIASLHFNQSRYDESETFYLRALAIREQAARAPDPEIGFILSSLAGVYRSQGRFEKGKDFARRALAILERTVDQGHPEVSRALRGLAGIHARQGENLEAERLLEEALAIDLETFGESHWSTASTYSNLGLLLRSRQEYAQSEEYYRRSIAAWEHLWPNGHPRFADALVGLANTYRVQGRLAEAEAQLRRALPFYENMLGTEHDLVANCLYELGNLLLIQTRVAAAEPFLLRALDIRERVLASDHPFVGESLRGVADLRRMQGRLTEAEPLYRRALAIWEVHPHNEGTQGIPESYAALLRASGRLEAATEMDHRAASVARADN